MEQTSSWEANNFLPGNKLVPSVEPKLYYSERKRLSLDPILSGMNLIWHLVHLNNDRTLKEIFDTKPDGVRRVGRPKLWWEDCVDQGMRMLEVKNWKKVALNRDEWAKLLKKAWAHQGLSSQCWWWWIPFTANMYFIYVLFNSVLIIVNNRPLPHNNQEL